MLSPADIQSSFTPIAPYAAINRDQIEFIHEVKAKRIRYGAIRHCLRDFIEFDGCAGTLSNKNMFLAPDKKTIIKRLTGNEDEIYESLQNEPDLKPFIVDYHGVGIVDKVPYIRLDNLLLKRQRHRLSVMDIKLGTRSFHESTGNDERKLSYVRYIHELDPLHQFAADDLANGITFDAYRQLVNDYSTSARLGYRIEGVSRYSANGGSTCEKTDGDWLKKTIRTDEQIEAFFVSFFTSRREGLIAVLEQLKTLRDILSKSEWFYQHELICTSLLIVLADNGHTVKLIDFGKARKHTNKRIHHDRHWSRGSNEDGVLIGLDNLINMWSGVLLSVSE